VLDSRGRLGAHRNNGMTVELSGQSDAQRRSGDRYSVSVTQRRALVTAALGFLHLRQEPADGLNAQGYDVELRQFPRGWRANLYPTGPAHSIVVATAWQPTPWRAVQQAAWSALGDQR
jgi:hypothetical protein